MERRKGDFSLQRVAECLSQGAGRAFTGVELDVIADFEKKTKGWRPSKEGFFIPYYALFADSDVRGWMLDKASKNVTPEEYQGLERGLGKCALPADLSRCSFRQEELDCLVAALIPKNSLLSRISPMHPDLVRDSFTTESPNILARHEMTYSNESGSTSELTEFSFGSRICRWHQKFEKIDVSLRPFRPHFWRLILEALEKHIIEKMTTALINGTLSEEQPIGILNYPCIDTITIGKDGGNPSYGHMVDLTSTIGANGITANNMIYAMTPEIQGLLQQTPRFVDSRSRTEGIVSNAPRFSSGRQIDGHEVVCENKIPKNLTKGKSNDCHAIIFGDFASIQLLLFGGIELALNSSEAFLYVRQAYDIIPCRIDSLAVIVDAQP